MNQAAFFGAIRKGEDEAVIAAAMADRSLVNCWNPVRDDGPEWDEIYPLHVAAKMGNLPLIKTLIDLGAEVYSNPKCTYPAVMLAYWGKHQEMVNYFLEEIPHLANGTNQLGVTCNLAGRAGWTEVVRKHVERDPLVVYDRGWIGDTPLQWPAHNGHIEIVRILLEAGAVANAEENNWIGGTPLHWASERQPDIIRLLAQYGADPNTRVTKAGSEFLGSTPLIWCARQRDDCAEAAQVLIELGADASTEDAFGKTALDYAQVNKNSRVAKVLS